jgi:hypothetical protein
MGTENVLPCRTTGHYRYPDKSTLYYHIVHKEQKTFQSALTKYIP